MTSELVKSVSITNLTNQRAACIERVRQALDLLAEARDIASSAHLSWPRIEVAPSGRCHGATVPGGDAFERIRRELDAGGWAYLMRESGLRTFMDAQARRDWDSNLYEGKDVPALTPENVAATFTTLNESRADLFERGVINCFRRLSWDYKTNNPRKFGKRIIVNSLARTDGRWLWFSHDTCSQLDDLARVFHVIDGKPEPDHRNGYWQRLEDAAKASAPIIQDDYCSVRWYKRGTGHLTFKRPDLVERLNQILAKHHPNALPAA